MNKLNRNQALLPHNCKSIINNCGTAMGMWFEKNNKIVVSMPGVPFEMKSMMENQLLSKLAELAGNYKIIHKTINIIGIPESVLAEKISEWEQKLPNEISLAYLPSPGKVRLRFSMQGKDSNRIKSIIADKIEKLKEIIPDSISDFDDAPLQNIIGQLLNKKGKTVSTAESCTGGKIAHYITSVAGSSYYFEGSIVAYSNYVKENILGVKNENILKHGAVSKIVVEEMAIGVRKLLKTDYSIATSGTAGPGGGTKEKPVGTIWIAVSSQEKTISEKFMMGEHRERNIEKSTITALNMLRQLIEE